MNTTPTIMTKPTPIASCDFVGIPLERSLILFAHLRILSPVLTERLPSITGGGRAIRPDELNKAQPPIPKPTKN